MALTTESADLALAKTAMAGLAGATDLAARLEEAPLSGMVTLKADLADPAVGAAVQAALGVAAPAPRKATFGEDPERAALWMAPDELMLLCAYAEAATVAARLEEALGEAPRLVEVASDARARFRLTGPGAREVLAKGAPVDLHAAVFGPGDLRRTRLAQVAVAFWQTDAQPERFELVCFRSYAPYVWRWLKESAEPGALPGVLTAGAP